MSAIKPRYVAFLFSAGLVHEVYWMDSKFKGAIVI